MAFKTIGMCLAALALGACASPAPAPAPAPQVAAAADQPVCEREYRIGSNIPVTTCGPKQSAADRERQVDAMRTMIQSKGGNPAK
jgi:hypothetical protein